jgi:hypothetical protein
MASGLHHGRQPLPAHRVLGVQQDAKAPAHT